MKVNYYFNECKKVKVKELRHETSVTKSLRLVVTTYHSFFSLKLSSNNNTPALEITLYIVNTPPEKRNERCQSKMVRWTMMTTSTSEMHNIGMCNIPFIIVVKLVQLFTSMILRSSRTIQRKYTFISKIDMLGYLKPSFHWKSEFSFLTQHTGMFSTYTFFR